MDKDFAVSSAYKTDGLIPLISGILTVAGLIWILFVFNRWDFHVQLQMIRKQDELQLLT